jgi:hypothetical protein
MAKRQVILRNRRQRSILTDMLPFEVPPTFSNEGFYRFLRDNAVEIEKRQLCWVSDTAALDPVITLLFGMKAGTPVTSENVTEWGKTKTRRSVAVGACTMETIPFNFRVAHKLDGRTLSVVHPRNQVEVADFYANHSALIIYYTSVSDFSIRRPVSVSRAVFFNDKLHAQKLEMMNGGIEEDGREYEELGSYFVYKEYRNIHRFFESYKYHRCEKKYTAMVQIDVNKCFDSIYTHSLSWAVLGKSQTKFNLNESKSTFAGRFDALMQNLNHKETNGIIIGSEFSRVFAEIILQSIDVELLIRLAETAKLIHKVDYEIFRYVDDYFVFYNEASTQLKVIETLQEALKAKKLSINAAKIKHYQKPIITEITVAKERISSLLNSEIDPRVIEEPNLESGEPGALQFVCEINSNRLIVRYKTAIKESEVEYGELLNYTFAIVENKLGKLLTVYLESGKGPRDRKRMLRALVAMIEFSFFVYSASPKVNHTIRICRIISTCVGFLESDRTPYELKHLLFKYVHENIMQQLERNSMGIHREVESLYLLISLSQIGKEYWLPESVLVKHFLIAENEKTKDYERHDFMSHFSITVLLSYIKTKVRYSKLHKFVEAHIIAKLNYMKAHCRNDAEALILFLDLIVCPYVDESTKLQIGAIFGYDATGLATVRNVNDHWFTAWGNKFNLRKVLDAKRSRDVY